MYSNCVHKCMNYCYHYIITLLIDKNNNYINNYPNYDYNERYKHKDCLDIAIVQTLIFWFNLDIKQIQELLERIQQNLKLKESSNTTNLKDDVKTLLTVLQCPVFGSILAIQVLMLYIHIDLFAIHLIFISRNLLMS